MLKKILRLKLYRKSFQKLILYIKDVWLYELNSILPEIITYE